MSEASAECPVCGTPISRTKYAEVQERIRKEEQAKLVVHTEHLRAQHDAELATAREEAARKAKQEIEQHLASARLNEEKHAERIAQLEASEATIRTSALRVQEEMRVEHEATLKVATAEAARRAKEEVADELMRSQVSLQKHTERIAHLEASEATIRASALRAQEEMRVEHEAALKATTAEAARRAKEEVSKELMQVQVSLQKQTERIAQLEASEVTLRADASRVEEELRTQFASELKTSIETAAQDARAAVVADLTAKDAELQAVKDAHAEELKHQRVILDEHRDLELQKLRNEHLREAEALQKKVQELNRRLDQKTAHELGEFPEIDLYQALSEAFPGDKVRRVRKGEPGADIVHEVMHNGRYCETIIYDSKNRRLWQKVFVEKLLTDKVNAKAEHAILVSGVFPTGQRDLCVVDGVVVAKLSQVVTIAKLLRDGIIADHVRKLSFKDRTEKKERLYSLITSEMFRQRMAAIERAVRELEKIDAKEVEDHRKIWTARSVQYRTADKSVRDLVTDVNVILENPGAISAVATGTDDPVPR